MGMLTAMSFIHGAGNFKIFGHSVYNFMAGMKPSDMIANIDEVPDLSIRNILKQVSAQLLFLLHYLE